MLRLSTEGENFEELERSFSFFGANTFGLSAAGGDPFAFVE